jgi:hypothetical protein
MATVEEIKQEIVDYLNKEHTGYGEFTFDSFESSFYQFVEDIGWAKKEPELKSGTVKIVKFIDAGEGDYSADTLLVFSVGEQLFRVDGHYESWAGGEWEANAMFEAEPVQVMVTDYQRKAL